MIYLAVFGAMVCAFACGYLTCRLIHLMREPKDACQPALEQLAEHVPSAPARESKKEVRRYRTWSEMRAKLEADEQ